MRSFCWLILAALSICWLQTAVSAADASAPNIIFLLADDMRYDSLGEHGNSIVQTPNLDSLARRGVSFDQAFVTTSICMISRASIMTGQHVCRHGITRFDHQLSSQQLQDTYFSCLRRAGYQVGFVGKWGVGSPPQDFFDYNAAYGGQGSYYGPPTTAEKHLTQYLGEQALEFLGSQDAEHPFCLSVSFKAPHVDDGNASEPFNYDRQLSHLYADVTIPPAPLSEPAFFDALPAFLRESENRIRWKQRFATDELYQKSVKGYYRLVTGMDAVVGKLREELARQNLAENTIIVFASDHGFYLGERGFAGKWFPHDVSVQIPLIIYDPRIEPSDHRRDQMVLNIDLARTFLDYAGSEPPSQMQGRSLRPLVEGESPADWRTEFYYDHPFDYGTIPRTQAVRTQDAKYIVYHGPEADYEELFDLHDDPLESRNLASEEGYQERLSEMRERLQEVRQQACGDRMARSP